MEKFEKLDKARKLIEEIEIEINNMKMECDRLQEAKGEIARSIRFYYTSKSYGKDEIYRQYGSEEIKELLINLYCERAKKLHRTIQEEKARIHNIKISL